MNGITVFCGSSSGDKEVYLNTARSLGNALAENNIKLIYGGASVGLMGAVADGALEAGGTVIGVLPRFLEAKEIAHEGLSELILVDSMHERKTRMNELSEGVIALPGGFGTLEEFFEMLTWGQLGLHKKPMALLNVNHFYDTLLTFMGNMVDQGFLKHENLKMILAEENIQTLLEAMKTYSAPKTVKWIDKKST
ncbi:MAG: TIGR00730 family Rossman fold protein [Parvularcula sp.]|nr:TIGR00730 family Rossman fold protein [Muricauda sp. UBA7809]MAW80611.1 TIGR00730 family Rossman fold protein [Parvularcula sp.]|tara:strand:+ start:89 stop:670 length:582 start_codon:yes stop_codon:yes gene_type:complete